MPIAVEIDGKGEVASPFILALAGAPIRLMHDETQEAHPFMAHGLAYRGIERAAVKVLDPLEQVATLPAGKADEELALAFSDVVYRSAEAF